MVSKTLKKSVHKEKKFLSKLYLSNNKYKKNKILKHASDKQIDVLINVLLLIVKGEIPLKKFHFETIKKSKRVPFLMRLNESMLEEDRKKKENFLCNITTYRELLHVLFNKE